MNMLKMQIFAVLLGLMLTSGDAWAKDQFDGLKCGADVPKFLIGKRASNEATAGIEARHKELGLKDLGGSEISDNLFLSSWRVCGSEYELLVNTKGDLIRDVIPFPAHSTKSPMFIGRCKAGKREIPATVIAVLDNTKGYDARNEKSAKNMLKASAAWRVDRVKEKFVGQPIEGLECPLGGVVTSDGGP